MDVVEAVGILQVGLSAQSLIDEATARLIQFSLNAKQTLEYYANEEMYLDGAPMHPNPEDEGLLTLEDNGRYARQTLGDDFNLSPALIRIPADESRAA